MVVGMRLWLGMRGRCRVVVVRVCFVCIADTPLHLSNIDFRFYDMASRFFRAVDC